MAQRPERARPRRLENDTLSYLKEVCEMMTQQQPDEDATEEEASLLLWNVLDEIAPRIASAASDRHGCEYVEVLLRKTNHNQLRFLFSKMTGYFSHLWTNRYSSHVLQSILANSGRVVASETQTPAEDDDEQDERMIDVPLMRDLVISMVKEVEQEWLTLMNDVSASHVFRSVLAALVGKSLAVEKRGKNAKHRALAFKGQEEEALAVPSSFLELFDEIVTSLISADRDTMLNLIYDRNSGPLISTALRLAPNRTKSQLVESILQWNDKDASSSTFYDFAGDTVTSHFLEAVLEVCEPQFFEQLYHRCLSGKLIEFSEHQIANYVVQNAMQFAPSESVASEIFTELSGACWTLLSMGRSGVVWRLVEVCQRFSMEQETIFCAVVEAVKKQESKKPEAVRRDFVAALLSLQLSTSSNVKLTMNVNGARIIESFMRFDDVELVKPLYEGILAMNSVQLLALAKDSTGSRCVIEPIWESTNPKLESVQHRLYERFVGHFGELALDRLGAFTVMKCFEKMDLPRKSVIVDELVRVEQKLSGSHFAQLVLNTCHVYEYRNNKEKWKALYTKKEKVSELFADLIEDTAKGDDKQKKKKLSKKSKKRTNSVDQGDNKATKESKTKKSKHQ